MKQAILTALVMLAVFGNISYWHIHVGALDESLMSSEQDVASLRSEARKQRERFELSEMRRELQAETILKREAELTQLRLKEAEYEGWLKSSDQAGNKFAAEAARANAELKKVKGQLASAKRSIGKLNQEAEAMRGEILQLEGAALLYPITKNTYWICTLTVLQIYGGEQDWQRRQEASKQAGYKYSKTPKYQWCLRQENELLKVINRWMIPQPAMYKTYLRRLNLLIERDMI